MAPPRKEVKVEVDGKEALLQQYLECLDNTQSIQPDGTAVLAVNAEEEADPGVTYFVDEEGRYYYQPAGDNQNIVSLPTGIPEEPESLDEVDAQMLVDGSNYQTVTLVPSEAANGEVSYVLVVQEDNKPVIKVDQSENEKTDEDDVYHFEEEEGGDESEEEEEEDTEKVKKSKAAKAKKQGRRPHFTCSFCSYTTPRRYLLLRHMKSHSEDRPHKCVVCERGFKTVASLQNHVNMHNGVKPHICKYCNQPFTTSGELVRHVRYKHTHEKPHKCSECDYASVELSKLRRHVRCHTGERPYQCEHCTYASPDTFKLKRHMRTHTGEKPYKCEHCTMCFSQSNSLKAHKLIHNISAKPVFACELCPTKCGRKTDLRIHVKKLHTSDAPLECKRCGKTFPDRYSCKIHNKTHEGEKCFKCDFCPYASTTQRHLKSHLLKHTDEKPYSCELCDQSFRQKQLLRRHHNLYHNPDYVAKPPKEKTHVCRECNRGFAHKGNLIRHLAIHDPDSGHKERALALKLGRQKKVKYVDASVLNLRSASGSESEEEEEEEDDLDEAENVDGKKDLKKGELVTVADGQQYVVLEVIQLDDGTEQHVAVVAPGAGYSSEQQEIEEEEEEEDQGTVEMISRSRTRFNQRDRRPRAQQKDIKLEKDVNTCFGFDEDEADDDELPQQMDYDESKVVLRIV